MQHCPLLGHVNMPYQAMGSGADVWAAEQAAEQSAEQAAEQAALMPLPPAFDGFVEHSKRVSPTCLINFERNRYSVPASFANRPISLRGLPGPSGGRAGSTPLA